MKLIASAKEADGRSTVLRRLAMRHWLRRNAVRHCVFASSQHCARHYKDVLRRWVEFTQYASYAFQDQLTEFGMVCSMSRKGNCWDNAPTESFFNSLKNERVHGTRYPTRNHAIADLFSYIEVFYNRSRRHSTLGYQAPTQFLQHWITTQQERKTAA